MQHEREHPVGSEQLRKQFVQYATAVLATQEEYDKWRVIPERLGFVWVAEKFVGREYFAPDPSGKGFSPVAKISFEKDKDEYRLLSITRKSEDGKMSEHLINGSDAFLLLFNVDEVHSEMAVYTSDGNLIIGSFADNADGIASVWGGMDALLEALKVEVSDEESKTTQEIPLFEQESEDFLSTSFMRFLPDRQRYIEWIKIPKKITVDKIIDSLVSEDLMKDPYNANASADNSWLNSSLEKALGIERVRE